MSFYLLCLSMFYVTRDSKKGIHKSRCCMTRHLCYSLEILQLIQIIKQSARVEGRVHSDTNLIDM